MVQGSCLCGEQVWQADTELSLMHHCHCRYCQKSHGAAFATMVAASENGFHWVKGGVELPGFESSPGFPRRFCPTCGSPLPTVASQGLVFMPAGCLDADPGVRPEAHIFAAARAPWFEIEDGVPSFDAFPPGYEAPVYPSRQPGDGIRGSCLCGAVAYEVKGGFELARHCHCSRCRKARGAAHASNALTPAERVRFSRGKNRVRTFRLPEARHFAHTFCDACGSSLPRIDPSRGLAIVPMGSLDDPPGVQLREHIWVGSSPPWYEVPGGLPMYEEAPPG